MSVTVTLSTTITLTDNNADDDSTPPSYVVEKTISGLNSVQPPIRRIVNNTTITLWSSTAAGALGDFDLAAIWCDTSTLEVEFTCNDGDAAEASFTVTLVPGIPLILGADDSRYNTGALSGTSDVIDLIRVKNGSATNAVVNLLLAT